MSDFEHFGLKEDWNSVEEVLREIIPVYDKTNRYISLGTDLKIRNTGLGWLKQNLGSEGDPLILDLGSGPGKMTQLLGLPTVMLDALVPMMQVARKRNLASEGVISLYENLPLRSTVADAALAGFAMRDARNLSTALSEINRILKPGGFFLIVDLSKPDSRMKRGMVALYWRLLAPAIAFLAAGRLGFKFAALSTTYRRLPTNLEYIDIAKKKGFEITKKKYFLLDGASILLLRKFS